MTPLLSSLLPLLASAAVGWLLRHYGILAPGSASIVSSPSTPAVLNGEHVRLLQLLTGQSAKEAESILLSAAQAAVRQVILSAQQNAVQPPPQSSPPAKS